MKIKNLLAGPAALALAISPMAAQAQSYGAPVRASAILDEANAETDRETVLIVAVLFVIFVAVGVGLSKSDPTTPPTSP